MKYVIIVSFDREVSPNKTRVWKYHILYLKMIRNYQNWKGINLGRVSSLREVNGKKVDERRRNGLSGGAMRIL